MARPSPAAAAALGCAVGGTAMLGQLAQPLFALSGAPSAVPPRGNGLLRAGSSSTGADAAGTCVAGLAASSAVVLGAVVAAGVARRPAAVQRQAKRKGGLQRDMSKVAPEDDIFEDSVPDVGSLGERTSLFGGTKEGPKRVVQIIPGLMAKAPPRPEGPFVIEEQIGAMEPLGFFDPLGFTKDMDKAGFRKMRAAEIKHGRVAMLATAGAIMQGVHRFPGFEECPSGIFAPFSPPATYGMIVLIAMNAATELFVWKDKPWRQPGDFEDPLQFGLFVPSEDGSFGSTDFRERELNNGRFAMFAALGIIAAELATGKNALQQLGIELPGLIR